MALGVPLPFAFDGAAADAKTAAENGAGNVAEVNAWVLIRPDETCVIRIARSEMGQGTETGLAQLVVEELECGWKNVATDFVTPGQSLARKRVWGEMGTGGSRGIRTSEDYVRRGGAAARIMLLQAAANEWKVPVSEVSVTDGVITHAATNRKTTYGKVAAAAAKLDAPSTSQPLGCCKQESSSRAAGVALPLLCSASGYVLDSLRVLCFSLLRAFWGGEAQGIIRGLRGTRAACRLVSICQAWFRTERSVRSLVL